MIKNTAFDKCAFTILKHAKTFADCLLKLKARTETC